MYYRFTSENRPAVVFVLLVSISIVLISFNPTREIQAIRNFVHYVFAPAPDLALKIIDQGKYSGENILAVVRMREENRYLKEEVNRLFYLEKKYEAVSAENRRLREILYLKRHLHYSLIATRVISHDLLNYFRSVTIDKGVDSGIVADSPVIAFINSREALVGRVASVGSSTSKVLLITDGLSAVPAKTTKSNENGVIQGQSGLDLTLDYLFQDSRIKIGDEVITSGIGEVFPLGLYIGVVQDIKSPERGYFKQAIVMPNMKVNELTEVFVIKPR